MEEHLELHLKEYAVKCHASVAEMHKIWQELEVSESARQLELGKAIAEACNAWNTALSRCNQHKAEVAAQISAVLDQTATIAEELGEASNLDSMVRKGDPIFGYVYILARKTRQTPTCFLDRLLTSQEAGLGGSMMARRARAEKELAEWRDRRANRLAQVEELQAYHLHTFSIHLLPFKSPGSPEPRCACTRHTQI